MAFNTNLSTFASSSFLGLSVEVRPPLCERPSLHRVNLSDLVEWRDAARVQSSRLASQKVIDRNGLRSPTLDELTRELDWYLNDAVEGSWKQHGGFSNRELRLRASLEELSQGWEDRILRRKPLEYLVSCARWRDLLLAVQEGVLIPRVETEQFVDLAKEALERDSSLGDGIWADIGTGTGAIAIAVARMLGPSRLPVVAVDADDVALSVARFNVARCHLEDNVQVVKGSWFSPFERNPGQKLAGVLSNPPYVPSSSISRMRAEACKHEPLVAMDGGALGTDHLFVVCDGAASVLRSGGFLALETDGGDQAHIVAEYLSKSNKFYRIEVTKDYAGIDRFVTATSNRV